MRYETHEIVKLISRVEVSSRAKVEGENLFNHPHPDPVKGEGTIIIKLR
ncbi:MAG TPA: hypothetical protein VNN20_15285 [Thermodesulfobacteriota bacterium]|nr:hypothetical protein [Thermodesulfobacteriota bacterium]